MSNWRTRQANAERKERERTELVHTHYMTVYKLHWDHPQNTLPTGNTRVCLMESTQGYKDRIVYENRVSNNRADAEVEYVKKRYEKELSQKCPRHLLGTDWAKHY